MSGAIQGLPPIDLTSLDRNTISKTNPASPSGFWDTLRDTFNQVQHAQSEADQKVSDLVTGKGEDIHSAMTAVEKADLSFELVMQVRNKIIQAYQQVSQIQF